jgi:diacylglycerol kinase family enzyme
MQGLVTADGLADVTLCVVPAGTENFFARDLGIDGMVDGFEVAEYGETPQLDIGVADDEPFVLSAIAGLPADASAAATHERKHSLGPVAFLVAGVEKAREFDGLRVEIDVVAGEESTTAGGEATGSVTEGGEQGEESAAEGGAKAEYAWNGEPVAVLVGNARRFAKEGGQADAEDGLLAVTMVEQLPPHDAVVEYVEQRALQWDTDHVTELRASRLDFESLDWEPVTFSLDGEIRAFGRVQIGVRPGVLGVKVGADYDPNP